MSVVITTLFFHVSSMFDFPSAFQSMFNFSIDHLNVSDLKPYVFSAVVYCVLVDVTT